MIRIVTVALAALLVAGPALAKDAPAAPVTIKGPDGAKQGNITFKHATHKSLECKKCHAGDEGGKPEVLNVKAGDMKNAAHGLCLECHKTDTAKKAPTKCVECHQKKA
jgi:c(7)-type cytochrome triheme protein